MTSRHAIGACLVAFLYAASAVLSAHSGPPYPIVSSRVVGAYRLSVWSDPDTTDDRSEGGKFWVTLERADTGDAVPTATRATVTVHARDRQASDERARTAPVRGDVGNQFAGLVLDHEGPYAVRVDVDGPLGGATVGATVQATYDLRPARWLIVVYVMPFLLVAFLWTKLLLRRRAVTKQH
jgi:hypothetical protein